jgi:hypothetical protein
MIGAATLCPDGATVGAGARCTHDALVAGVDARWRSTSGAYLVESDVAASTVRGGPPRVQRDGIVIAGGDSSPQGRVRVAKEDNGPVFDVTAEADGRRFDVATDPRMRVTASWSQAAYFVAHGITYTGDGDVTIHALPQLDVEVLPSVLVAHGEPRYVLTDLSSGNHVFARQDALAVGVTLRTTYTFTPRATLQLYAQLFGESVAYSDFGRVAAADREVELGDIAPTAAPASDTSSSRTSLNASAVFRWEWRLGSTLYAVYPRSQGANRVFGALDSAPIPWTTGLGAASTQVFLLKLSYWW